MDASLLVTKIRTPPRRDELVIRPRLPALLDQGLHKKLTLVSAPAGFGKTTLVAQWAVAKQQSPHVAVAWLALDASDNDLIRFLHYLLAALAEVVPAVAENKRPLLESAHPSQPEAFLTALINALDATAGDQIVLVLDDYHLITAVAIHQAVTFLLTHQPACLHLVLVTRADPPLPLARWRARSQLVELRQQDLRFTASEATDFLTRVMALPLPAGDVATLNRRTEGWIAGLQMAAVSLQNRNDTAAYVRTFGGSNRYVLDYLMEEVLARQPQAMTDFLLQTAVLDRLCAPLCEAILATGNQEGERDQSPISALQSQQILAQLETDNLFLVPLDDERRWYRYHRLFADLLRQRLKQTWPARLPELHRRAAAWYEAHGYFEEAIGHAMQADAPALAADLIAQVAEEMLMRSEMATVKRWLGALPAAERWQRPSLSLYYAWALIMDGHAEAEVEMALQPVIAEGTPGELALVRSYLSILRGSGADAVAKAQQALAQLGPDRAFLRGVATWILGVSQLFVGELEAGLQTLEAAVQFSRQAGNLVMAVASLSRLARQAWRDCDLHRAQRIYRQALALATDDQERPLPIAGETLIGMAGLRYEWNDLETAREYVNEGITLTARWRDTAAMGGYLWLARLETVAGDIEAAREAVAQANAIAHRSDGTELDDLGVAMWAAEMHLRQGNLPAAQAWAAARGLTDTVDPELLRRRDDLIEGHLRKYEYIVLARVRLAEARPAAALAILSPLLANARRLHRLDLQLEIHILMALAHSQQADAAPADRQMAAALALGQPGDFVRTFVDAGPAVAALLARQQSGDEAQRAYLQKLLFACDQAGGDTSAVAATQPLIEPLSERELEVLALIAGGLSNREIAQELVISLPTVKWHTSNIYGKLDVGNRTAAVARARELHILD